MKLIKVKKWYLYQRFVEKIHHIVVCINPKYEAKRCYRSVFGRIPNIDNPTDFIEKTYWLQLHSDTSLWTKCADKYLMREYIEECGLGALLPKVLGVWQRAKDIDFASLPNSFVIKTNHATETCMIVKDIGSADTDHIKKILNKWMRTRFGYSGMQLHYLKIKPLIFAEELLVADGVQRSISPQSLIDYKIYCCSGIPQCIWIAYNRTIEHGVDMNIYDLDWISHPEWTVDMPHYHFSGVEIPRPKCLDDMISYCKILAKPFPEVRIDYYVINDRPYIGELTFTSGFGFFTPEFYNYLGSKIDLSNVVKKQ